MIGMYHYFRAYKDFKYWIGKIKIKINGWICYICLTLVKI